MKKLLVAVDGSKHSKRALAMAKEIGKAFESEITVVYVMEDIKKPPYTTMNKYHSQLHDTFEVEGHKMLDAALESFKDYGHNVGKLLLKGSPGNEIVKESENGNYDLIIIGSRGLGAISRFMLGGVSNKVVNKSKISVLVVK